MSATTGPTIERPISGAGKHASIGEAGSLACLMF